MAKKLFLAITAIALILIAIQPAQAACASTKLFYSCNLSMAESTCAADGAQYFREELRYSNISGTCCNVIDDYRICYYEVKGSEGMREMVDRRIAQIERWVGEYLFEEICGGPLFILPLAAISAVGVGLIMPRKRI